MIGALFAPLGSGDCEALGDGWLLQPVAAWTSLAYAAVGIVLMISAASSPPRERTLRISFGFLLVGTGIGSFLYHGPQPAVAGFVHDITFLATLWFLIIMNPAGPYGLRRVWGWATIGAVAVVLAIVLALYPSSTNLLATSSVAALVVSDLLMHKTGGINGRWYATALVLLAGAVFVNILGRSGAPTCTPDHVFQFHGLWHVLSAMAVGAYFIATVHPRNQEPHP